MEKFSARFGSWSTAVVRKPALRQALDKRQLPAKISRTKQDRLRLFEALSLPTSFEELLYRISGSEKTWSKLKPEKSSSD